VFFFGVYVSLEVGQNKCHSFPIPAGTAQMSWEPAAIIRPAEAAHLLYYLALKLWNSELQIQNCSGIDFDKLAAVLIYLVPGFGHGFGHRGALLCNSGRAGFSSSLLSNAS